MPKRDIEPLSTPEHRIEIKPSSTKGLYKLRILQGEKILESYRPLSSEEALEIVRASTS